MIAVMRECSGKEEEEKGLLCREEEDRGRDSRGKRRCAEKGQVCHERRQVYVEVTG